MAARARIGVTYTLDLVAGSREPFSAFNQALWSENLATPVALRELVFLRSSIVNGCAH